MIKHKVFNCEERIFYDVPGLFGLYKETHTKPKYETVVEFYDCIAQFVSTIEDKLVSITGSRIGNDYRAGEIVVWYKE